MSVERIDIVITENGSRTVSRNIEQIGTSARGAGSAVTALTGLLSTLGLSLGISQLIKYADTYQNIQNRLQIVTTSTQNLNRVTEELFQIAQRTRVGFEATAQIYSRLAQNTQRLGISQKELLGVVETINKTVALSGATSIEARNALIQFSQGMASGTLRGDELRSVLEQLPGLAQQIAKGIGVAYEDLRKLAKDDKLTPDTILTALKKQAQEVEELFKKLTPTISQSMELVGNSFIRFIGQMNQANSVAGLFSNSLKFIADNMEAFAAGLFVVTAALTAMAAASAVAALANPFVLAVVAIAAAATALQLFGDQWQLYAVGVRDSSNVIVTFKDVVLATFSVATNYIKQAWASISEAAVSAYGQATALWAQYGPTLSAYFNSALEFYKSYLNTLIGVGVGTYNSIVGIWNAYASDISAAVAPVVGFLQGVYTQIAETGAAAYRFIVDNWSGFASTVGGYVAQFADIVRTVANTVIGIFVGLVNASVQAFSALPAALGDIGFRAANALIEPIISGINKVISGLNSLGANLTPFQGAGLNNPFAGAASNLGQGVAKSFSDALSRDYVGETGAAIKKAVEESRAGKVVAESFTESLKRDYVREFGGALTPGLRSALDEIDREAQKRARARQEAIDRGSLNPGGPAASLGKPAGKGGKGGGKSSGEEATDPFLEAQKKLLKDIKGPLDDYLLNMRALDQLLKDGKITNEEYERSWEKIRLKLLETRTDAMSGIERGLIKIHQEASNTAKLVEDALTNAFKKAEDTFINFIKTGKINFKDFATSIIEDLARIAFKQAVTAPLSGFLSSLFGGASGGGGGGNAGGLFDLLKAGNGFGQLSFGFATGGDFTVPETGKGVDSGLVAFRASPGEVVSVNRPGASGGSAGGRTIVNFNISTPNPEAFRQSEAQIAAKMQRIASRAGRVS